MEGGGGGGGGEEGSEGSVEPLILKKIGNVDLASECRES